VIQDSHFKFYFPINVAWRVTVPSARGSGGGKHGYFGRRSLSRGL